MRFDRALKEAAIGVQQVEMGELTEGRASAGEDVAGFEHREVEGFAVVADECAGGSELAREPTEEATVDGRRGQEIRSKEEAAMYLA